MSPSIRGYGISVFRAIVAALFTLLAAGLVWFSTDPLSPLLLAMFVLVLAFLTVSVFDVLRAHSLYPVVSSLWTTMLFACWALLESSTFAGALAVLSGLGVLVEYYNYRHGTSYLRLDA